MNPTDQMQEKPKYRPQPRRESQDQLINFQLTQQNMLGLWNKDAFNIHSKSPLFSMHNNDDLTYSDNENDGMEQHQAIGNNHNSLGDEGNLYVTPVKKQKILLDRVNLSTQPDRQKEDEQNESNHPLQFQMLKRRNRKSKTQQAEQHFKQNKSCCFQNDKSVFFSNNNKNNSSTIIFRVKPRPNIRQLAENAQKTERNQ